jgi:hypothetical protein
MASEAIKADRKFDVYSGSEKHAPGGEVAAISLSGIMQEIQRNTGV